MELIAAEERSDCYAKETGRIAIRDSRWISRAAKILGTDIILPVYLFDDRSVLFDPSRPYDSGVGMQDPL